MKKFLPSFFLFLLTSLFLTESSIASPLRCKTHSSRACKDKGKFVREQKDGCASPAGNCRWYFCKANCVNPDKRDRATLRFCKKNCLNTPLLARFNSKTREALYTNFYPKGKGKRARKHSRDAYGKEYAIQDTKSKRWWKFWGKSKKSELLERLKKENDAQIARNIKRMEAAKARGDTRKAKKIERKIAASLIQKYWRGRQGRKEAKRIKEQRTAEVASLIEDLPPITQSAIISSVNSQLGVYKTDASGKQYFIPNPPPLPPAPVVIPSPHTNPHLVAIHGGVHLTPPKPLKPAKTSESNGTIIDAIHNAVEGHHGAFNGTPTGEPEADETDWPSASSEA
jgi:hypothetical protein